MPAFAGGWCEALVLGLNRRLPGAGVACDLSSVFGCFRTVDLAKMDSLFAAISDANRKVADLRADPAAAWAVSLICFAAIRCLDLQHWARFKEVGNDDPRASEARAAQVATNSVLLASIGVAGLLGQIVRLAPDGRPSGSFEISHVAAQSDYEQAVLGQIYDGLPAEAKARRINPDNPIGEAEIGILRSYLRDCRREGRSGVVFIGMPATDAGMAGSAHEGIARAINTTVIQGSVDNADGLIHPEIGYTVSELHEEIRKRFDEIAPKLPAATAPARSGGGPGSFGHITVPLHGSQ